MKNFRSVGDRHARPRNDWRGGKPYNAIELTGRAVARLRLSTPAELAELLRCGRTGKHDDTLWLRRCAGTAHETCHGVAGEPGGDNAKLRCAAIDVMAGQCRRTSLSIAENIRHQ